MLLRVAKENRLEDQANIDAADVTVQAGNAVLGDAHPVPEDKVESPKPPSYYGNADVKSPGEKKFEMITYKGIGWLTTAGLGIALAQILEHGKGRVFFEKSIEHFTPKYQKLMNTSEQVAHEAVSSGLTHVCFIAGASIPVYPIKKLEDNKATIVEKYDQAINDKRISRGDNPTEEELAIQEKAHARLRAAPKQTWPSLLVGRALGVSTVFFPAIFLVKGADKRILENIAQKVTPNKAVQSFGVLTALEVGYSFISEEVLHFTSQIYAKSKQTPEELALREQLETPTAQLAQINSMQANQVLKKLSIRT